MSDTEFNEAVAVISEQFDLPKGWTEGVVRSLGLAKMVAKNLGDSTLCVAVQFHHSQPGRTVLADSTPAGLTLHPADQRAIGREDG